MKAIIGSPDDDASRLTLADWLEEQGESARAEFIRLQCELFRLRSSNKNWQQYARREKELLKQHGRAWIEHDSVPRALGDVENAFERGFVNRLFWPGGEENYFLREAKHYFAATPLEHLTIGGSEEVAAYLAKSRYLLRLRSLFLYGDGHGGGGIHDEGAHHLARSRYAGNLRSLKIEDDQVLHEGIADSGVRALASSIHLAELRHLQLLGWEFGDEGVAALAQSKNMPRLQTLTLSSPKIGDVAAYALAASSSLRKLKKLELWLTAISDAGKCALQERFGQRLIVK
jgi:uncharacterized protein (TIGR02996 family)